MQLIFNSTGGRVPKFWRPPFGDTDVRVSAIAKEVCIVISFKHHAHINFFSRLGVQANNCGLEF
jgi:hypothetical protein